MGIILFYLQYTHYDKLFLISLALTLRVLWFQRKCLFKKKYRGNFHEDEKNLKHRPDISTRTSDSLSSALKKRNIKEKSVNEKDKEKH